MVKQRRDFLKCIAAAGFSATTLSFSRLALAETAPRRVIFVYFPDGMRPEQWHAQGIGTDFTLPAMTQPLETVKQHCVFLSGINMYGSGSTHEGGVLKLLTGAAGRSSDKAVSLDYYLGQQFKAQTVRPHLNLNIVPVWDSAGVTFDFNGLRVVPEPNPLAAYASLFGSGVGGDFVSQRRLSVLDSVRTELNALRSRLGNSEKTKLDTHLESLRELEQKLTTATDGCAPWNFNPTGFTVTRTAFWSNPEYRDATRMGLIGGLQMDIAAHALACDLTRVVTLTWGHAVNEAIISESGSAQTCHQASHNGGTEFVKIKSWYCGQLARLIVKLNSIPEGSGTLLDNTLIFVGSELGHGGAHSHDDMPFILAGGKNAGMVTGRSLKFAGVAHNKLLVSIAQFMGVNVNQFGTEDKTPGTLPGFIL
jgi:hypothetical protein